MCQLGGRTEQKERVDTLYIGNQEHVDDSCWFVLSVVFGRSFEPNDKQRTIKIRRSIKEHPGSPPFVHTLRLLYLTRDLSSR